MASISYEHIDMLPEASDFLELLRELGHLDDAAIEALTSALMQGTSTQGKLGLADVRRAAAAWLAEHEPNLRPEQRELLAVEWPRLFS